MITEQIKRPDVLKCRENMTQEANFVLRRKGVISSFGVPQVQSSSGMQSRSPCRWFNPENMDDEG